MREEDGRGGGRGGGERGTTSLPSHADQNHGGKPLTTVSADAKFFETECFLSVVFFVAHVFASFLCQAVSCCAGGRIFSVVDILTGVLPCSSIFFLSAMSEYDAHLVVRPLLFFQTMILGRLGAVKRVCDLLRALL